MLGKTVFITGGTSGYGQAMAARFCREGARVIIAARSRDALRQTADNLGCAWFQMDVTVYDDWLAAREMIRQSGDRLDVLINNAGGGVAIKGVEKQTREEIDRAVALNLTSVIYAASVFSPLFMAQRGGNIINLSSVCARHCWPEWSVYAAAKAGVLNFSKGLYTELRPYGVRVCCLIPGAASTGFQKNAGIGEVKRQLAPEDVAQTALYVCKLPAHAVAEEITLWGVDQEVTPL